MRECQARTGKASLALPAFNNYRWVVHIIGNRTGRLLLNEDELVHVKAQCFCLGDQWF